MATVRASCPTANASDEAIIIVKGEVRRRTSDTILNKESSRSHSVFIVKLVMSPLEVQKDGTEWPSRDAARIVISQLCLVDLAGSERTKRTLNTGERLAEASKINQSLLTLRQCLEKMRRNQRNTLKESVPYRDA